MVKTLPKAPLKSRQVTVKILPGIQTWNQKPGSYPALWGWCWGKNTTLKLHCIPAIGAWFPSDWCIMHFHYIFFYQLWQQLPRIVMHLPFVVQCSVKNLTCHWCGSCSIPSPCMLQGSGHISNRVLRILCFYNYVRRQNSNICVYKLYESQHDRTNKMTCAPRED